MADGIKLTAPPRETIKVGDQISRGYLFYLSIVPIAQLISILPYGQPIFRFSLSF